MGWGYTVFRAGYEIKRKMGFLKAKYPIQPDIKKHISLTEWKKLNVKFFFDSKEALTIPRNPSQALETEYQKLLSENYLFFNSTYFQIKNYDWITNPSTGYKYDSTKHWTLIEDTILEAGDIKFVWELSRFSFLYTAIRYDYHFQKDCSAWVFDKIEDWIDANPINCGPNYKCSQEIGLRVMNWTFALHYYKNSEHLTDELFTKIMHHINWQIQHVYDNINFSLKTVRNNHAIAETLSLYFTGLLYPFLPNANKWKTEGKQLLETEIAYQIYEDGSYLMFSTNYQRTVLLMLTWLLYLTNANQEKLKEISYQRIFAAFNFLYQCQDSISGQLPNYGHNDGSLFCKLNDSEFRNFRSQLNATYYFYNQEKLYPNHSQEEEEAMWYSGNFQKKVFNNFSKIDQSPIASFNAGGFFIIRDKKTLSFIRCGIHKDRPSQADNLHLDIWDNGKNILRDAGTYKYNTTPELVQYFSGTTAHNTATLGDHDQMQKGPRFIWLNWSQSTEAAIIEEENSYVFRGRIHAFQHLGKDIYHDRTIIKSKLKENWLIIDKIEHQTEYPIYQYWNITKDFSSLFDIEATDESGNPIKPSYREGYYSGLYGLKEETVVLVFETNTKKIKTKISKK